GDAGERYDLVTCLSGSFAPLVDQDLLMPIDLGRLKNWTNLQGFVSGVTPKAPGVNKAWGVPYHMNADSFLYAPRRLGVPDAPEEISWKLIYDDPRTKGRVALDNEIYALICASIYVKAHKLAEIDDLANMTTSECRSVADFLIERKQAGQFRTFYKSYDEQLQLLLGGEVIAESGWEPVAREAQRHHDDVAYAYTVEGYDKWAQNLMVPAQVADRKSTDKVHATIDWMLSGAYAAELSTREGYMTPRLDLGLTYAQEHGWGADRITVIRQVIDKGTAKLSKPLFWDPGYFTNFASYHTEMARFRNA
ncbi:extracellular solute-binding protein, partial [Acetobacteraceae bacterium]|nr:extracellular solute-binding protein [Acetobacteraceae bacterium]